MSGTQLLLFYSVLLNFTSFFLCGWYAAKAEKKP